MKKKQKKQLQIVGVILAIVVLGLLMNGNLPFAILSSSSVQVGGEDTSGGMYWVVTGTAENVDSGYTFTMLPDEEVNDLGETITPKDSLTLKIQTEEKNCEYSLSPKTSNLITIKKFWITLYTYNLKYYTLLDPERNFKVKIDPDKGETKYLDGSLQDSVDIEDPDGKGTLTVQTQGALVTKDDCPDKSDVAIIESGGKYKVIYKSELDKDLSNVEDSGIYGILIDLIFNRDALYDVYYRNYDTNSDFTSEFNSYPTVTSSLLVGEINIGNPVFTITADQDFFNSFVYTPPQSSDPYIDKINVGDIKSDGTGTISVVVGNRNSNSGNVLLEISSPYASFTPSSENFALTKSSTRYFTEKANNVENQNPITAKVCTVNQFGDNKCDSKTVSQSITRDEIITICGDNICQSNENDATCPKDCYDEPGCKEENEVCTSDTECCTNLDCYNGKCIPSGDQTCESCTDWGLNFFREDVDKCQPQKEDKWYVPDAIEEFSAQNTICPIILGFYAVGLLIILAIVLLIFSIIIKMARGKSKPVSSVPIKSVFKKKRR